VRVPKDLYGRDFANHLIRKWAFRELRQTGSHIILRTEIPTRYTVSVPAHKPLRPGTLREMISAIADHKQMDRSEILRDL
jgi:predicted RNA binding protein YcfA (HicA-like mRNA interferase family)